MGTTSLTRPHTLRSSECLLTGPDIASLSENWEVGFTDFPPEAYSVVSQMLDHWWGHTGLRTMPLALLRRKLRLALHGKAPDRHTEKKWQRQVDQLIAKAISTGEVELVPDR